jgi:hypothetical protein
VPEPAAGALTPAQADLFPEYSDALALAVERAGGGSFTAERLRQAKPELYAALARAVASGVPEAVAARIFLVSVNTVKAIRNRQISEPANYGAEITARARVNALRAAEELQRRIEEAPAGLTASELLKIAESGHEIQQLQAAEEVPQRLESTGSITIHFGGKKNQKIIDITPAAEAAGIDS